MITSSILIINKEFFIYSIWVGCVWLKFGLLIELGDVIWILKIKFYVFF
jgi:hypothetical protein